MLGARMLSTPGSCSVCPEGGGAMWQVVRGFGSRREGQDPNPGTPSLWGLPWRPHLPGPLCARLGSGESARHPTSLAAVSGKAQYRCGAQHRAWPAKTATPQVGSFLGPAAPSRVNSQAWEVLPCPLGPSLVLLLKGLLPAASPHPPSSGPCLPCPLRSAPGKDHAAHLFPSDSDHLGLHEASTWTPVPQASVRMACQKL